MGKKKLFLILLTAVVTFSGCAEVLWALGQSLQDSTAPTGIGWNAYGPGVHADRYGRTFHTDPNVRITPNALGPGIGVDQYGRPTKHPFP